MTKFLALSGRLVLQDSLLIRHSSVRDSSPTRLEELDYLILLEIFATSLYVLSNINLIPHDSYQEAR